MTTDRLPKWFLEVALELNKRREKFISQKYFMKFQSIFQGQKLYMNVSYF